MRHRNLGYVVIPAVVIALLGMALWGLVPRNPPSCRKASRVDTAAAQMKNLAGAARQFHAAHGRWPDRLETLTTRDPKNFNDAYIDALPPDPWGLPYRYERSADGVSATISCRPRPTLTLHLEAP